MSRTINTSRASSGVRDYRPLIGFSDELGAPTTETYEALQSAYNFFNRALFGGTLKSCLITLQRSSKWTLGYYWPRRFIEVKGEEYTDEIAMNPRYFTTESLADVLSTLVHEQVHLWQFHFGRPSRRGYHNKGWGAKMKEIGLYPSNTGTVGGKETGQQMTHYVIKDGPFDRACKRLLSTEFALKWGEVVDNVRTNDIGKGDLEGNNGDKSNRVKYWCPVCSAAVWGKPKLNIICGECMISMGGEE